MAPKGRFWLGRLAPEIVVQNSRLGERSERLEPCEVGVRVRPTAVDGRHVSCSARLVVWGEFDGGDDPDADRWRKTEPIEVAVDAAHTPRHRGRHVSRAATSSQRPSLASAPSDMVCEFHGELELGKDGPELVVTLVNVSPEELDGWDTNVYEASMRVDVGDTLPFTLDNLPDSFRYSRTVPAYGVNGGVEQISASVFGTTDVAVHDQPRPIYWDPDAGPCPDVTFATLAERPPPVPSGPRRRCGPVGRRALVRRRPRPPRSRRVLGRRDAGTG